MTQLFFGNMAVPKKKTARSYSKTRYTHYEMETQKRILDETNVVKCTECGAPKRSHTACSECGKYRGRQVLQEKKAPETTRVQA